jgi:hypothetical protein
LGRGSLLAQATDEGNSKGRPVPQGLFDVKHTYAHTAAGVVRLLLRWVNAAHRSLALRDVIDDGFIFCLITGLCETRHFSKRRLAKQGVVAILAHRMALHVAASQQWRALAPSLAPPRQFQEDGLRSIECAQDTAFYAFLKPLRLSFSKLKPCLPIICIAWGKSTKQALLALPHKAKDSNKPLSKGPRSGGLLQDDWEGLIQSSEKDVSRMGSWRPSKKAQDLTTFLEVASEHLSHIQLVDCVNMCVLTGKVVFLMYSAAVETAKAPDADRNEEASVLLLDAARGMQVVASPVPVRELRRCAL